MERYEFYRTAINSYMAKLQSHCIETGISVRRDCNLSKVRLESHFAEIIWYWDAMSLRLYAMPATRHIGSTSFLTYRVSENFSDTPKSLVEVGYDEEDTTGMLVWWSK